MYTIAKIDLTDTCVFADFFDDEAYSITEPSSNLPATLMYAIDAFKDNNPKFHTYDDWIERAESGAYEIELFWDSRSIFRGSMLLLSIEVERALLLAIKYHMNQTRKGDGLPYLIHILEISKLLYGRGGPGLDPVIIASSLCHDLIEDTDCSEEVIQANCGDEVLRLVKALSNDGTLEWKDKKKQYIKSVEAGGEKAMIVCLADKIVNIESLLKVFEKDGEEVWQRFNRGKNDKLWFEEEVFSMLSNNLDHPLLERYERDIEKLRTS